MATYIALLRAVNVGTGRKVPMTDLRAAFEDLGHANVATYIQSGNVVFDSSQPAMATRVALEERLASDFGFDITVLLRTPKQLARVAAANPYGPNAYVTFLEDKARAQLVRALDPEPFSPEAFTIDGTEVYLHLPNGAGRTKLNNTFFEQKLATRATTRNWNTVNTLLEMTR